MFQINICSYMLIFFRISYSLEIILSRPAWGRAAGEHGDRAALVPPAQPAVLISRWYFVGSFSNMCENLHRASVRLSKPQQTVNLVNSILNLRKRGGSRHYTRHAAEETVPARSFSEIVGPDVPSRAPGRRSSVWQNYIFLFSFSYFPRPWHSI